MGEKRGVYRVLLGTLRERDHSEDLGVDGSKIIDWILKKELRSWTGLIGLGYRQMAGSVLNTQFVD
jgi:hypothetical protein